MLITLLFLTSQSLQVLLSEQCSCTQLLNQFECVNRGNCSWQSGSCIVSTNITTQLIDTNNAYCSQYNISSCSSIRSCAFYQGSCVTFAGCSAYQEITNSNCWLINKYCNSNGLQCVDAPACTTYLNKTSCEQYNGNTGICVWSTTCRQQQCSDAPNTTITDLDCSNFLSGCITTGRGCASSLSPCETYLGDINTCAGMVGSNYNCEGTVGGTNCKAKQCSSNTTATTDAQCQLYQTGCVTTGQGCVQTLQQCSTYTGTDSQCRLLKGSDGKCVGGTGTNCKLIECSEAIGSLSTDQDCAAFRQGCVTTGRGCISLRGLCSSYSGINIICDGMIGTDGNCKTDITITNKIQCIARTCADTETQQFFQNTQCIQYQTGCILKIGGGCEQSQVCTTYADPNLCLRQSSCQWQDICITNTSCSIYLNQEYCNSSISQTGKCFWNGNSCVPRTCSQASTDFTQTQQCQDFLSTCITNSNGCTTAPVCADYQGTKTQCENLTNIKCSNSVGAISTTNCLDRTCYDNTTASSDSDCDTFLSGCITNGAGCVKLSDNCSLYKGNQDQCELFIGSSKKIQCTNTVAALSTAQCIDYVCTSNTVAENDSDCQQKSKNCVFNGTAGCINIKTCSQNSGTNTQCSAVIASDGPCKGTSVGTGTGSCTPKLCSDALLTLFSDAQCNSFYPGCVSNGQGCQTSFTCDVLTSKQICQMKSTCGWTGKCQPISSCSSYTSLGQTYCINAQSSGGFICQWSANQCVQATCSTLNYNTELQCQQVSSTCTYNGTLCQTVSTCASYSTQLICNTARTTDTNGCIFVNNQCRIRQCVDSGLGFATDSACNTFLFGCITGGTSCIDSKSYQCFQFTQQQLCIKDSSNNQCKWINQQCQLYTKCTDAFLSTYSQCQNISKQCSSNGAYCMPLDFCKNYNNQIGCYKGLDGLCGWKMIPFQCQLFSSCSDYSDSNRLNCGVYNTNCTSDGQKCINIDNCSNYQTQYACYQGLDGFCTWNNTCRLGVCTDKQYNTHEQCNSLKAKTQCTSNGQSCIPLDKCQNYNQFGCYIGSDGNCIWQYPLGLTVGLKLCRLQVCTDILLKTTKECQQIQSNCISNGVNCITKVNCNQYFDQYSCYQGGLDGQCSYSQNKCVLVTSCQSASYDKITCNSLSSCKYQSNGLCANKTCQNLYANGQCYPLLNFNQTNYTICQQQNQTCIEGNGTSFGLSDCFYKTAMTYTWDPLNLICKKCYAINDTTSTNNQTNTTVSSIGFILYMTLYFI